MRSSLRRRAEGGASIARRAGLRHHSGGLPLEGLEGGEGRGREAVAPAPRVHTSRHRSAATPAPRRGLACRFASHIYAYGSRGSCRRVLPAAAGPMEPSAMAAHRARDQDEPATPSPRLIRRSPSSRLTELCLGTSTSIALGSGRIFSERETQRGRSTPHRHAPRSTDPGLRSQPARRRHRRVRCSTTYVRRCGSSL